jgi:hypothetical protein
MKRRQYGDNESGANQWRENGNGVSASESWRSKLNGYPRKPRRRNRRS